jgi:hypothetical protein
METPIAMPTEGSIRPFASGRAVGRLSAVGIEAPALSEEMGRVLIPIGMGEHHVALDDTNSNTEHSRLSACVFTALKFEHGLQTQGAIDREIRD